MFWLGKWFGTAGKLHYHNNNNKKAAVSEKQYSGGLREFSMKFARNIAPTSVFSEQAFSIAGNLITKYRNRLSDQSIDDLCFEKGYFLKEGLLD